MNILVQVGNDVKLINMLMTFVSYFFIHEMTPASEVGNFLSEWGIIEQIFCINF